MKTKVCKDCGKRKPLASFYASKRSNGRTYHASYCKACSVARSRKNERTSTEKNFAKLWQYFAEHPCVDCGEDNPLKLSLDHRDEKNHDISNIMKRAWYRILEELALCDVRCHNCHALRTAAQRDYHSAPALRTYLMRWPENATAYNKENS